MKLKFIANKLLVALGTILLIITINFILVNSMPGDPIINIIGDDEYYRIKNSAPEVLVQIEAKYGLDESLPVRYLKFVKSIVTLDFGYSYIKKQPVADIILYRLRWTLTLAIPATILAALIGGFFGIKAGWKLGGRFDKIATPIAMFLNTVPSNCIAILALALFSYKLKLFPISGMSSGGLSGIQKYFDILLHMALPLFVIVLSRSCGNFINMKSYVSQIKGEEYVLTAVSKGLPDSRVLNRHVLRNCFLPYLTIVCMQFGHIISGSVIVETVFSWVGMGNLMSSAVTSSDFPMMQLTFLLTSVCAVMANLVADFLYILIDPRMKEDY